MPKFRLVWSDWIILLFALIIGAVEIAILFLLYCYFIQQDVK